VRTAFRAALASDRWPRLLAALRACRERRGFEALDLLSFFNALLAARERLGEARRIPERPFRKSRSACLRTRLVERPAFGGRNSTPARRAFDKPIAIACSTDLAPCFPSRT